MSNNLKSTDFLLDSEDQLELEVYFACASSYANGIVYGGWLDVTQPIEKIQKQIKQLLAKSPMEDAEECVLQGYSGFGSLYIDAYESIEQIHEKALFVLEHGELGTELAAYYGGDLKHAKGTLEEYYEGEHESELDYSAYLFDKIHLSNIPEDLQYCISYERFQRAIFINDYFSLKVDGKYHVFRHH